MKQGKQSVSWLAVSKTQAGSDPLMEQMKRQRIPLTAMNYVQQGQPDRKPGPLTAEEMELVPRELMKA